MKELIDLASIKESTFKNVEEVMGAKVKAGEL